MRKVVMMIIGMGLGVTTFAVAQDSLLDGELPDDIRPPIDIGVRPERPEVIRPERPDIPMRPEMPRPRPERPRLPRIPLDEIS